MQVPRWMCQIRVYLLNKEGRAPKDGDGTAHRTDEVSACLDRVVHVLAEHVPSQVSLLGHRFDTNDYGVCMSAEIVICVGCATRSRCPISRQCIICLKIICLCSSFVGLFFRPCGNLFVHVSTTQVWSFEQIFKAPNT